MDGTGSSVERRFESKCAIYKDLLGCDVLKLHGLKDLQLQNAYL